MSDDILPFKKILVPVDGSPASKKAAKYAIHIARNEGANIVFLHVLEGLKQGGAIGLRAKFGDTRLFAALQKEMKQSAEKWMSELISVAAKEGVSAESEVIGDIETHQVQVITDYAKNNEMDLIVMGSRGRSKFKKMIVGSVADGVLTYSGLPVLVTR